MKKIIPAVVVFLLSFVAIGHNPLQGTKWEKKDEKGNTIMTINFEQAASGLVVIEGKECAFKYSAGHTSLNITMDECEGIAERNIISCCETQTIPFRGDAEGNLVLIIDDKEHVLMPVR